MPTAADGDRIAEHLVSSSLAACVQVTGPVSSTYRWDGAVERATEHLVIVKTTEALTDAAIATIVELHPYEVPELIVTPVLGGHGPYLTWVAEATR